MKKLFFGIRAVAISLTAALALLSQSAFAYNTAIWDFTSGGSANTNTGTAYGNVRTFSENVNGFVETITANSWADTGLPNPPGILENAYLGKYSTGLGSCNRAEGSISYCDGNDPLHQFDNFGQEDLVMFRMDQGQYEFNEIVIDPFGTWDRDVSWWVGDLPMGTDLSGLEIGELVSVLGFTMVSDTNGVGSGPLTINLNDMQGNTLIFGAIYPPNRKVDRFKIASLTATLVPIPAAVWLFGSALGFLGWSARRRSA